MMKGILAIDVGIALLLVANAGQELIERKAKFIDRALASVILAGLASAIAVVIAAVVMN